MKKLLTILLFSLIFQPLANANETSIQANDTQEIQLYVKEMNCQLCVYLVNKELRAVEGVQSTKANMNAHTVKIVADKKVAPEQLIQAVEKLHYSAEKI